MTSELSTQTILNELKLPRDLIWELEMLACFPLDEDSNSVEEVEWDLLERTINGHTLSKDLEILARVENLKLVYNTQAQKHGKPELSLNLTVTPWQRRNQTMVMHVVQCMKYEEYIKKEKEAKAMFASPSGTSRGGGKQPNREGKRIRLHDLE